jgi:hypothetical protein
MKNRSALLLCLFLTLRALSQSDKDSAEIHIVPHHFLIGTFFDFSTSDNTRTNITTGAYTGSSTQTYGGDLTAGFTLSRKWAFLVKGGYSESMPYTYLNEPGVGNITLYDDDIVYSVTPTLRYYKELNEDNFFFLQARLPISFGTYTTQTFNSATYKINTDTYNKFGLGAFLMPGFSTFISKHISAEIAAGSFGYSYYDGKDAKGNTTHTGGFDGLLYLNSVSLGFVFYF